ncbi:hypothetical protein WMF38_54195 [Sorangium sp. So ce118]
MRSSSRRSRSPPRGRSISTWSERRRFDAIGFLQARQRRGKRLSVDSAAGALPLASAGTSLFAEMAEGEGILLDASPDGHAARLAAGLTRVRCLPADAGPSMLIRPDGCIAWAGDVGDVEGLVDALERWFASAAPRPGGFQERSCSAGPSSSAPSRSEQRT